MVRELTGCVFGSLTVEHFDGSRNGSRFWSCRCECGREQIRTTGNLRNAKSCGCRRGQTVVHGHARRGLRSITHVTWIAIIQRCTNPKNPNYARYGARGLTVCDRWRSFENFLADMGERPVGKSIDRIDGLKGYSPENCRWATNDEQGQNRRTTRLTVQNVLDIRQLSANSESRNALARRFGVSVSAIKHIVHRRTWSNL